MSKHSSDSHSVLENNSLKKKKCFQKRARTPNCCEHVGLGAGYYPIQFEMFTSTVSWKIPTPRFQQSTGKSVNWKVVWMGNDHCRSEISRHCFSVSNRQPFSVETVGLVGMCQWIRLWLMASKDDHSSRWWQNCTILKENQQLQGRELHCWLH